MSLVTEVIFYMVAFAGLLFVGYITANAMTRGFVWGVTKVRIFGQWKGWMLIKVHTISKPYYRVGKVVTGAKDGTFVTYVPRNNKTPSGTKVQKMIKVPKGAIQNNMGIDYLEVDEETNNVLSIIDWKVVSGHDAETVDALYKRIAMLPKSLGNKELIILISVVLILLLSLYTAYKLGKVQESVDGLYGLYNVTHTIAASAGNLPQ